jgi:hypothetical protein
MAVRMCSLSLCKKSALKRLSPSGSPILRLKGIIRADMARAGKKSTNSSIHWAKRHPEEYRARGGREAGNRYLKPNVARAQIIRYSKNIAGGDTKTRLSIPPPGGFLFFGGFFSLRGFEALGALGAFSPA